jgi:catechol-2,3-dioxygenase
MVVSQSHAADPPRAVSPVSRTSTSHLAIRVADVAAASAFYQRVVGLAVHDTLGEGGLRLGWGRGHHVLDLLPGGPGLDHFAFAVDDPAELERIRSGAVEHGLAVTPASGTDWAPQADGFEICDPAGHRVQFHGAVDRSGEIGDPAGNRPIRLQHFTLGSPHVGEMLSFFRDVLGFRHSDVLGENEFVWLRSNREHHTLAVVRSERSGLDHFAFEVTGWEELKAWCDRLTDEDVPITWGPGRHGPGNNLFLFFDDPDGNRIELSAELERFHDDRVAYAVRRWDPVPKSVNLWGGLLPGFRNPGEEA